MFVSFSWTTCLFMNEGEREGEAWALFVFSQGFQRAHLAPLYLRHGQGTQRRPRSLTSHPSVPPRLLIHRLICFRLSAFLDLGLLRLSESE